MEKSLEYYLNMSVAELKNVKFKKKILFSEERYLFTHFCQYATQEQVEALLDDTGISLLDRAPEKHLKINGLLTSGKEFPFFENEEFCKIVIENNGMDFVYNIDENAAVDFSKYLCKYDRKGVLKLFNITNSACQLEVLKNGDWSKEEILDFFEKSRKETAEYMLKNRIVDPNKLSINQIDILINKKIAIPGVDSRFIEKVASICDVNTYRELMNKFENLNDSDLIEEARRGFYENELATIGEDGLLEKFRVLKEKIKNKEVVFDENAEISNIPGFTYEKDRVHRLWMSQDLDNDVKRINDYYISNMIIDYFFNDIPTNVLKNLSSFLTYDTESPFLNEEDRQVYDFFCRIDELDVKHKLMLFDLVKESRVDMVQKFYDDFSRAQRRMIDEINGGILNDENVREFYHEEMSAKTGVPIYLLNGQPFNCLVRNIGVTKSDTLIRENLDFRSDGSSFSIDGSNLLRVFGDNKREYVLAYKRIPEKQLIHSFPTDSYTHYSRELKIDIPKNEDSTDRVIEMHTLDKFTSMTKSCNEFLISVPHWKKHNEFEEKLEKPEPFAIYCYDIIRKTDIESAKELGLGIIVVDTRSYDIDRSGRIDVMDTLSGQKEKYNYVKNIQKDMRGEI